MGVDQTELEVPGDAVGRRVSCGEERATVRYVGPVPPTAGLWLGVEWDNPERGKHDGSHEGVQYFACRNPKGGSFVRPAKVSFGVDFLSALTWEGVQERRYEIRGRPVVQTNIRGIGSFHRPVFVCSFDSLPSVLLSHSEVNGAGAEGEIKKTTPNVRWLDLSGTLLSCWGDVAAIAQQLDKTEVFITSLLPSFQNKSICISYLLISDVCLSLLVSAQILECAPMWPQLEDLCVVENTITEMQRPDGVLQSLKSLNLSSNPLVQHSLLSISALPRLEQLNLSSTGLSAIQFDDAAPGKLTAGSTLSLSQWAVVDELAKLPGLVQFSCRGNRLVSSDGNPKTANQMLIAKLGRLVVLNSCEIYPEDRRGAELDYIKMFGEEWLKSGGRSQSNTQFTCQHPRYQSLIDKYGAPEEGELKKPQPFALKNQLLRITFVFPDDADRKPIEKKLPASMGVQKVKGLLYRLLKVPAADLRLSYTSPKMVGTEFEIESDLKTLQFYSIEDGDQVLVRWT
uniref:Tubulin-specific chaperone E n=1 Tax=Mastacembelus armatus TaxID=205130 RepID=A0A7N8YN08_9TELE